MEERMWCSGEQRMHPYTLPQTEQATRANISIAYRSLRGPPKSCKHRLYANIEHPSNKWQQRTACAMLAALCFSCMLGDGNQRTTPRHAQLLPLSYNMMSKLHHQRQFSVKRPAQLMDCSPSPTCLLLFAGESSAM